MRLSFAFKKVLDLAVRNLVLVICQDLAPAPHYAEWLSRRQRACPSVFLDKQ